VWVRTILRGSGNIRKTVSHSTLPAKSIELTVRRG
jgi:hypothetical protein